MSEHLKQVFSQCVIAPPPAVWDKIAGEVNRSNDLHDLQNRISAYGETPRASLWLIIKEHIRVTSLTNGRRYYQQPIYRIMTAAAFTGLVVMGSFYIFNKNASKKQLATHLPLSGSQPEHDVTSSDADNPAVKDLPSQLAVTSVTFGIPGKQKKAFGPGTTRLLRNTIITLAGIPENVVNVAVPARPIRNEIGDIIQDTKILATASDPYIKITGPNGKQTKISAKFRNLLLYLNRDNDLADNRDYDDKSFTEGLEWKTKFRNWRNKILENAVIPTSTNYMDIVELKDLILKDKDSK